MPNQHPIPSLKNKPSHKKTASYCCKPILHRCQLSRTFSCSIHSNVLEIAIMVGTQGFDEFYTLQET